MTAVIDRIDTIIINISGRDIVPTSEMTDELLDLRLLAMDDVPALAARQ